MNEDRLRRLLQETVDDLAPADRWDEIREAAHDREAPMTGRKYAVLVAAAAATAAVVGTVAWAGGAFDPAPDAPPAQQPTTAPTGAPDPSDDATPAPGEESFPVAVYWLGDTPQGVRLYREFRGATGTTELDAAVRTAIASAPEDPDYWSPWGGTDLVSASVDRDLIRIELDTVPTAADAADATEASRALEQVIRTAQAAVGDRLPVQFMADGNPVAEVFGQPTSEPLAEGEWSEVLSLVSLSDPAEGATVTGDVLAVTGVASSFEATVPWRILQDGAVVDEGFFTAEGWADRLHPFGGDIDVAGLAPGTYVLEVSTSDPSGGEGPGPFRDTRTFVVR